MRTLGGKPEREGTVVAVLPRGLYRVACAEGSLVKAHLTPEARLSIARLLEGERVILEVSLTNPNRGRIMARSE